MHRSKHNNNLKLCSYWQPNCSDCPFPSFINLRHRYYLKYISLYSVTFNGPVGICFQGSQLEPITDELRLIPNHCVKHGIELSTLALNAEAQSTEGLEFRRLGHLAAEMSDSKTSISHNNLNKEYTFSLAKICFSFCLDLFLSP